MKLSKLSLKDKPEFDKYLGIYRRELSVYAFGNIFIWKDLYDIEWVLERENLYVFFRDSFGCFLYLPPLGKKIDSQGIEEAFRIMDKFNKNTEISRVENIEGKDVDSFKSLGYRVKEKSLDYLCRSADLAGLRGDKFKSKRASCNYFTKNYQAEYLPYLPKHKEACLELYHLWMHQRLSVSCDPVYQGMFNDSLESFKIVLDNYPKLDYTGRVVFIAGELKAFTFGYKINNDTFCILYEITDLTVKGLAQFIFREFAAELKDYTYINIMDDSGLENLKKVKLSYHPVKLVPAYIAKRQS